MVGIMRSIYYTMGWHYWKDPPEVDEKTKRQRHLLLEQIKNTKNFKFKKPPKYTLLEDTDIDTETDNSECDISEFN